MKINKRLIMSSSIIIFIIGILLYFILSNPYLNYYKKSDLDTNIYPINPKYEMSQTELNKGYSSLKYILDNKEILPITKTKDGSNYINMLNIYETNVLKSVNSNIYLYNKLWKEKNIDYENNEEIIDEELNLLMYSSLGSSQQFLNKFIPYIKNPKVKESAYNLLNICNQINESSSEYLNIINKSSNFNELPLDSSFNIELIELKNNYKNMEHGSICAKDEWNKLTLKYIKGETEVNSNSNFL